MVLVFCVFVLLDKNPRNLLFQFRSLKDKFSGEIKLSGHLIKFDESSTFLKGPTLKFKRISDSLL